MDFLPEGINFNRDITYLAKTNFRKDEQIFGIKRRDRRQHMYVLGKSGTGKSVLLENMIVQNIWNGEGVCVIDPHGELVEKILATIPPHRAKDVIYFNPADMDYHIGFNVLQIDDPRYKHLVASGLMGIFTKIWANAWSARMEYILNNAILALVETPGSTLLGIPRLLVDKDYRQQIIANVKDPVIRAFWVHEFEAWREQYRNEAIAPIQNKVGQFLSSSLVRNVVGQSKSTIDLFEMMNTGKIFIVNVSKGRIGEDNSALLGGMLITKIQLAAMERVRIPEDDRKDFYLYVDEFQNFVTDSFASILSEARKYRLNLTLAHQYIAQLSTKDSDTVRDAIFGNVGTMIVFRVGAVDGEYLEKEFDPEFTTPDMVNLPNYKIYLKLMVDGVTSRPFSASTLPPFKIPENSNVQAEIIESSRALYARSREDVEREINEWSGMGGSPNVNSTTTFTEGKFKAVCSSCGKETTVPFEPEEGRPVYCKECIAKIKSGELKPLKGSQKKSYEPQAQSFAELSGLGIEFASEEKTMHKPFFKKSPEKSFVPTKPNVAPVSEKISSPVSTQTQTPKPAPVKFEKPISTPTPILKPIQKPFEPKIPVFSKFSDKGKVVIAPRERKGPDHEGLQSILKEALGNAMKPDTNNVQEVKTEIIPTPVAEVKKTISLSSLKTIENNSHTANTKSFDKNASTEKVSALQEAINRARNSSNVKTDTKTEIKNEIKTETETETKAETPDIATTPDVSPKKVREVPEEVLRTVLN
ncbi:MAG: CxxC-x17-CxxC domain-containing protein [bacterium]